MSKTISKRYKEPSDELIEKMEHLIFTDGLSWTGAAKRLISRDCNIETFYSNKKFLELHEKYKQKRDL